MMWKYKPLSEVRGDTGAIRSSLARARPSPTLTVSIPSLSPRGSNVVGSFSTRFVLYSLIKMDKDRNKMTERILNLTLEIIYLLIGEVYTVVKKSEDCMAPSIQPCVSGGWSKRQVPYGAPQPHSLIHGRRNEEKILELTNKIIQMLTGEVPIRCQDITIYLSMEEWEYLEGHEDQYKDIMMEDQRPLTPQDKPNKNDIHERCRSPQDGSSRHLNEPQHQPIDDLIIVKVEEAEEDEEYYGGDLPYNEEKTVTNISIGDDLSRGSHGHRLSYSDCEEEHNITHDPYGDHHISPNLLTAHHSGDSPSDSTTPSEPSPDPPQVPTPFPWSEYREYCRNKLSCSTQKTIHRDERQFPCPECEKCFSYKSNLYDHLKIHTGEKPYLCSDCGKCFTRKSDLVRHHRTHTGERPYSCPVCGKSFAMKSILVGHQRTHTGEKPFSCLECGNSHWGEAICMFRMTDHSRMDTDRTYKSHNMAEQILNLTLEIIYLLSGEDYMVVKKSGVYDPPKMSGGGSEIRSPMLVPPSLIQERSHVQKIIQLTNKIIELLSGEVPIRCQDVTVHLSMEEWEYLEGHKDQYKEVMMEDQRPLTPQEYNGSNTPEGPHSPPCCQDDPEEIQDDQVKDLIDIKDEVIKEDKLYVRDDGRYEEGEPPTDISTEDFSYTTSLDGRCLPIYPEYELGLSDMSREHPCPSHIPSALHSRVLSSDSEEASSDQSQKRESFQCSECGKCFKNKINLMIHKRTHQDKGPFSCLECGKYFSRKQGLLTHERVHTGEKPYSCPVCGRGYTQKSILVEHQKSHTGKTFSCSDCGRGFIRKTDFIIHQRIHTGEKPYMCLECGKCFTRKQHLVGHQKIHTGEKPFSCSECDRCFAQKSDLSRHRKVHTGERPFSCSECGKCFTWRSALVEHQRTHSKEKPYLCPICGKNFTLRSHLAKHRKIHTRVKALT